jgi:hypothetical protein
MQVFLPDHGIRIPGPDNTPAFNSPLPASLVIPAGLVFRNRIIPAGWLIPALDTARYLPWHMITDPASRKRSGRENFSFRHRVACCRNLAAALISVRLMDVPVRYLSERTVFVGDDSSVRILYIPGISSDGAGNTHYAGGSSLSVLIFRMLMDGYHPFHATGPGVKGYRSPERRMKAGLYPWDRPGPDLRPPPHAPGIDVLPRQIRTLFSEEFDREISGDQDGSGGYSPAGPGIWFEILDHAFLSLIRCTEHPDHWYQPENQGCPWCRPAKGTISRQYIRKNMFLPLPGPVILRIAAFVPAGYLMLPRRFRRRKKEIPVSTGWNVIPLTSGSTNCLLLAVPGKIPILPSGKTGGILLIPWKPSWMVPVTKIRIRLPDETIETCKGVVGIHDNLPDETIRFRDEISLIDEMRWASATDRIRSYGICTNRKQKAQRMRTISIRKKPVDIMLMPADLPWPDESGQTGPKEESIPRPEKKRARKKGAGKGIRGKLQSILRDFIEPGPDDK